MAVAETAVEAKGLRSAEDGKSLQPSTGYVVVGPVFDQIAVMAELKKKGVIVYSDFPSPRDQNVE